MCSENEYEAGRIMSHHANLTCSDNKDPDNSVQFYLGICAALFES